LTPTRLTLHRRMEARRRRSARSLALLAVGGVALTACGAASRSAASPQPPIVAAVETAVTGQMLTAASHGGSRLDEGTFTLTARTADGKPAAHEPVSFWVGPMAPLSGSPPAHWFSSASAAGRAYVASSSSLTDSAGRATIVLLGQPSASMVMVAVKVGTLSTFAAGHGVGLLDAWWTSPTALHSAPVGDRVTVSPFLTSDHSGRPVTFRVRVTGPSGAPARGASVSFTPKRAAGMAGGSMGSMSGGGMTRAADREGVASYTAHTGTGPAPLAVRIVVTDGSGAARFAGSVTAEALPRS
jgi:hypothetical protein